MRKFSLIVSLIGIVLAIVGLGAIGWLALHNPSHPMFLGLCTAVCIACLLGNANNYRNFRKAAGESSKPRT